MSALSVALLFVLLVWTELFLGSLTLLCFDSFIPTAWFVPLRATCERGLRLWPLVLVLFVAVVGIGAPWSSVDQGQHFRAFYLQPVFLVARDLLFLLILFLMARRFGSGRKSGGALGLIFILLVGSGLSIDWLMSLEAHWRSTSFGLIFLVSGLLMAFGFALSRLGPTSERVCRDLGTLHLALIGTWAYLNFTSFLIIWSSDLPPESAWAYPRTRTSWNLLALGLIFCQAAVPIFLLLFSRFKKSLVRTRRLGAVSFISQIVFTSWLLFPALHRDGLQFTGWDPLAVLIMSGGFWFTMRRAHAIAE